ncbi:hypothetical protein HYU13_04500 [Candidatus Woesearchaeota archaeon]|nr:hypothetical protein [Candidatus Woesearchaeota archaeon]
MMLPMPRSRKGIAEFGFQMIGYLVGYLAFLGILSSLLLITLRQAADTHGMEFYLAQSRLLYSPDSFFVEDKELMRSYPSIVDSEKLKEETLLALFAEQKGLGIKFQHGTHPPVFYNRDFYEVGEYVLDAPYSTYTGTLISIPSLMGSLQAPASLGVVYTR